MKLRRTRNSGRGGENLARRGDENKIRGNLNND